MVFGKEGDNIARMSLTKIISGYAGYNYWANTTMTEWLKTLESSLLHKETPSSFGSISLTLQHMSKGQNFWFAIITEANVSTLNPSKHNSADATINDLLAGSLEMLNTIRTYNDEGLAKKLPLTWFNAGMSIFCM
jgi:uncharacterized damage-inducible protein DinB